MPIKLNLTFILGLVIIVSTSIANLFIKSIIVIGGLIKPGSLTSAEAARHLWGIHGYTFLLVAATILLVIEIRATLSKVEK